LLCSGSDPAYNLKADIYTFGLVLWELLTLEKPLGSIESLDMLFDYVGQSPRPFHHITIKYYSDPNQPISFPVNQGGRPEINTKWPISIQNILQTS
jgi:serine/threonine protein kinase